MRLLLIFLLILIVAVIFWFLRKMVIIAAAYSAKVAGSGVFVAGRSHQAILKQELKFLPFISLQLNERERSLTASAAGLVKKTAVQTPVKGCHLVHGKAAAAIDKVQKLPLANGHSEPLPVATEDIRQEIDYGQLGRALKNAMSENQPGIRQQARAVVVLYKGQLVAERYGKGFDKHTPLAGWSLTKSVLNALTGILVKQGRVSLEQPVALPEWQAASDPRQRITVNHLLQMSTGLKFSEVYSRYSDATHMLFLCKDAGKYAASQRLQFPVGQHWAYSSGTSNILSRFLKLQFENLQEYLEFPYRELFWKLGMQSAVMETDASGTFVGSSYMYATAQDWARFGQLYLQDGQWNGERVLPEGWVDYTRTPAPAAKEGQYGAHFWLNARQQVKGENLYHPYLPADLFFASGFEEQRVAIVPSSNVVVVRLGLTYPPKKWDFGKFMGEILEAFPGK